jgi:hypothetical protein
MLVDTRTRGWRASDGRRPLGWQRQLAERTFRRGDIPAVRRLAEALGARAGIGSARLADFVLAVNEAAACVTAWGPCTSRVRLWVSGGRAFCEVRGDALARCRATRGSAWHGSAWYGSTRPDGVRGEEAALRRLVLRKVPDCVSVASGPDGAWVLLSMSVAGG